jgi:hypothetical protein
MKEILKLMPEQGREIIYGDNPDFQEMETTIEDQGRWTTVYSLVVRRKSDGKYFKAEYRRGSTEMQDESPYEYDSEAIFTEVKPVSKTVIVYE